MTNESKARTVLATTKATDAIAPTEGASRRCQSCGNDVAPGMDADHEDWCSELGWKKRALEAEELNRKFMASVNGPAHMGEPVIAAPSPEAPAVDALTTGAVARVYSAIVREDEWDCKVQRIRILDGANLNDGDLLHAHPASEPKALTDDQRSILIRLVMLLEAGQAENGISIDRQQAYADALRNLLADRGSEGK